MEDLVLDEYRVEKPLGRGAFGQVVSAVSTVSGLQVAIKLEEKIKGKPRFLTSEGQVLSALQGGEGIPKMFGAGKYGEMQCIVMELLGPNLSLLFKQMDKRFSLKTVIEIAVQGVDRVRHIHDCYYMHRDIKPQNFMFGLRDKQSTLYIADFGLAKKYQNGPRGLHIPYKEDKCFVGTACYASLNTHLGIQQSRRDDLESLMYILCFLLKKRLPWQKKYKSKSEKHTTTRVQKMLISNEELFRGCPQEFALAFSYVRGIGFDDRPDYNHIKSLFLSIASEERITLDEDFDWMHPVSPPPKKGRKSRDRLRTVPPHEAFIRTEDVGGTPNPSGGEGTKPKQRRSVSPPSLFHTKISVGVLPIMPSLETSENSSYEGWQEEEHLEDEKEGDDTIKETKGPTINRSVLPTKD